MSSTHRKPTLKGQMYFSCSKNFTNRSLHNRRQCCYWSQKWIHIWESDTRAPKLKVQQTIQRVHICRSLLKWWRIMVVVTFVFCLWFHFCGIKANCAKYLREDLLLNFGRRKNRDPLNSLLLLILSLSWHLVERFSLFQPIRAKIFMGMKRSLIAIWSNSKRTTHFDALKMCLLINWKCQHK